MAFLFPNVPKNFLLDKVRHLRAHTQELFMKNSHGYKYMPIAYVYRFVSSIIIPHIILKLSRKLFPKKIFLKTISNHMLQMSISLFPD